MLLLQYIVLISFAYILFCISVILQLEKGHWVPLSLSVPQCLVQLQELESFGFREKSRWPMQPLP